MKPLFLRGDVRGPGSGLVGWLVGGEPLEG